MTTYVNDHDVDGNPAGGYVYGEGLDIIWQDGSLNRDEHRREPNGAQCEDVIEAVKQRIHFLNTTANGRFYCDENSMAWQHLHFALVALNRRTVRREAEGTEGTHSGS